MLFDSDILERFPKTVQQFSDKRRKDSKRTEQFGDVLEPFTPRTIKLGEKQARISGLLRDFAPIKVEEEALEILSLENEGMEPLLSPRKKEVSFSHDELEEAKVQAFAAGLTQGKEETQAQLGQQFAEERVAWAEKHAQEIEETRTTTINHFAVNWEQSLRDGLDAIKSRIEQDLAVLLSNLVGSSLTKQAMDDFSAKIAHEAMTAAQPLIIEGKQELLDAFAAITKLEPQQYQLQPTELDDVRVVLKDGVISTRLAPLMQELKALI